MSKAERSERFPDPLFDHDLCRQNAVGSIAGVDEVGRGALAGPVVAAAVVLPPGSSLPGVTDSKKMTRRAREEASVLIREVAAAWSIGEATPQEVDDLNVRQATFLAMRRAVEQLRVPPELVAVDGRDDPGLRVPVHTLVGGDRLSLSIASASVLAKVTRDRVMQELAEQHPNYGFERHVGYGTKVHREAIIAHGPTPYHRLTFLRSLVRRSDGS